MAGSVLERWDHKARGNFMWISVPSQVNEQTTFKLSVDQIAFWVHATALCTCGAYLLYTDKAATITLSFCPKQLL